MIRFLNLSTLVAVVCIVTFSLAPLASAQERSGWRGYWENTEEGGDIDYDEIREWRERSSRINDRIDDLDEDPVENVPIPILFGVDLDDLVANFGDPRGGGTRSHEGLDMMAPDGAPIVTPTEAVVIRVGSGTNSGIYVSTANPGGETFVYMHLARAADIEEGDVLDAGELIGYVGNTGNASGGSAHLHFEMRKGREAMDPLPRLTEEFSLEEKMEFAEEIVEEDADIAAFFAREYGNIFIQARTAGIDIPDEVGDLLGISTASVAVSTGVPARDLTIGSEGSDVSVLQSILIAGGHLDIGQPTGYFGPLTQSALISYQSVHGISPASGYYGPLTRQFIENQRGGGDTRAQLVAQIAELTALVAELQAQLAAR